MVGVSLVAFLGLAFYLREVFNPLLLGLLLAYILNPVVEWLEGKGVGRSKAVALLFSLVLVVLAASGGWAVFKAANWLQELRTRMSGERVLDPLDRHDAALIAAVSSDTPPALPRGEGALQVSLPHPHEPYVRREGEDYYLDLDDDGVRKVGLVERGLLVASDHLGEVHLGEAELAKVARGLEDNASSFSDWGIKLSQGLKHSFGQIGTFFNYLFLVPVYAFFLLSNFTRIRIAVRDHLPEHYRGRIVEIALRIDRQVAAFFRGKLTLCLLKGIVTSLGLWISGVPLPLLIGMLAGFLSIVPFIGPVVGGSLALALGFGELGPQDEWLPQALGIGLTLGAAEAVEGVAGPVILGREVGINPLLLVLSFFVFGALFGMFGVLLAVPFMSVAKTLFEELLLPEIRALAGHASAPVPKAIEPALPSFAAREAAGGAEG